MFCSAWAPMTFSGNSTEMEGEPGDHGWGQACVFAFRFVVTAYFARRLAT